MMENSEGPTSISGSRPGLVLTAIGPDRPGLVKDLAGFVRRAGGNIEDTRMSKLGGEFAVLILVTGAENSLHDLATTLGEAEQRFGVTCFSKRTATSSAPDKARTYHFSANGLDRTGIVEGVTHVLAERGVNVLSFASRIENAPLSGTPIFHLHATVHLPLGLKVEEVRAQLDEACAKLDLESELTGA